MREKAFGAPQFYGLCTRGRHAELGNPEPMSCLEVNPCVNPDGVNLCFALPW